MSMRARRSAASASRFRFTAVGVRRPAAHAYRLAYVTCTSRASSRTLGVNAAGVYAPTSWRTTLWIFGRRPVGVPAWAPAARGWIPRPESTLWLDRNAPSLPHVRCSHVHARAGVLQPVAVPRVMAESPVRGGTRPRARTRDQFPGGGQSFPVATHRPQPSRHALPRAGRALDSVSGRRPRRHRLTRS